MTDDVRTLLVHMSSELFCRRNVKKGGTSGLKRPLILIWSINHWATLCNLEDQKEISICSRNPASDVSEDRTLLELS